MSTMHVPTKSLKLVPQTREEVRAYVEQMQPHERAAVSPAWLASLDGSSSIDPWIHGFVLVHRATESVVGKCGFKGPPGPDGAVEIAYGVVPEHQGRGYATEPGGAAMLGQYRTRRCSEQEPADSLKHKTWAPLDQAFNWGAGSRGPAKIIPEQTWSA